MTITYTQTHWDSALVLFRQRSAWQRRELSDAAPLERLEKLLRLHFHVLSRCPQTAERKPQKAPDTFVKLASLLSSSDVKIRHQAVRQAAEVLSAGGPKSEGAYAALALFAPPEDDRCLLELYQDHEKLRPLLFRLWRDQGFQVPPALYNRAELQGRDPALQLAALAYAADSPRAGLETFRAYYQPLLGAARPLDIGSAALCAALWGGMVRGDRELGRALRRAIELEATDAGQLALLRLAALSADVELYPVLRSLLNTNPQAACRFMALYGHPEALRDLAGALEKAASMEAAARAWQWSTGSGLARKPRLSLLDAKTETTMDETMPDSAAAKTWLQLNLEGNPSEVRWFQGRRMSTGTLTEAAIQCAGQGDADIIDLLALHRGGPLGISPNTWRTSLRQSLARLKGVDQGKVAPPGREGQRRA